MGIGVYICEAGGDKNNAVNLEAVAGYAASLPQVSTVKVLGLLPDIDPELLAGEIASAKLDRVVVAGDSPGFFKPATLKYRKLSSHQTSPWQQFSWPRPWRRSRP